MHDAARRCALYASLFISLGCYWYHRDSIMDRARLLSATLTLNRCTHSQRTWQEFSLRLKLASISAGVAVGLQLRRSNSACVHRLRVDER